MSTSNTQSSASTSATLTSTTAKPQFIALSSVGSTDSYLTLLDSKGTAPYVDLARELRKLPQLTNATAVAQISTLALDAANPETKEAFELMMKGGTPNSADFGYQIPQYNTELQVLYWLASSRHLKYDDTLALAISLSNGLWVTIGDGSVQLKVKGEVVGLLDFFRETDGLQQASAYPRLEQLPLEAKIALSWLGGDAGTHGPHAITGAQIEIEQDSLHQKMNLAGYEWDAVSVATLRQMRDYVQQKSWAGSSADQTVANLEDYFYFSGFNDHFNYTFSRDVKIVIGGELVPARNNNNPNFEFQYYLENGKAIGVCEDEATLVGAFLKSWGIATLTLETLWPLGGWYDGHSSVIYFEPAYSTWRVYQDQIGIAFYLVRDAYVVIPPALQSDFIPKARVAPKAAIVPFVFQDGEENVKMYAQMYNITGTYLSQFEKGVSTDRMKQWILYKTNPPAAAPLVLESWSYAGSWAETQGGPQGLVDSQGTAVGDLGQSYADLAKLSYAYSDGYLLFRFDLKAKIPTLAPSHVTSIWYQVLMDSNSDTGYRWSADFAPAYMITFMIQYDTSANTLSASTVLSRHCGSSTDWCWDQIAFTQHYGVTPLVLGGVGQNYFVLTCNYHDIGAAQGSTVQFFGRSGIRYDDQVYNAYIPVSGTISLKVE
jgi:hypothetical protein